MANLLERYRQSLAAAGIDDPRDDLFIVKDFLGPLAEENRELFALDPDLAQRWREIREANSASTVEGIVNTAKSAFDRSVQAKNVLGTPDETDVQDIAEREQRIRERPTSVAWQDWQKSTGADAVKAFLSDPVEITSNIVASGLAGSLPAIGAGLAGGAAGAAAGPAGGVIGAAVGTGAGSLAVEYGSKYLETLVEAGADLADPDSIARVVSDPETRARAQEMGLRRGIPVAVFDAASAGLAGKFLKGVRTATTAQNIARGAGEAFVQGGLGGAGEIAGALSAGEEIKPGAVFEEVIGELGPGAAEVAGASMRRSLTDPYDAAAAAQPGPPQATMAAQDIPQTLPIVAPEATPFEAPTVAPTARTAADIVAAVEEMTDEQKLARFAELSALPARAPEQEVEFELLRAEVPQQAAVTIPTQPEIAFDSGAVTTELDAAPIAQTPNQRIEQVFTMGPAEFTQFAKAIPDGMTGEAHRLGITAIGNPNTIRTLKSALVSAQSQAKDAEAAARAAPPETRMTAIDAWSALGAKVQFFSEAIQAAENTGSAAGVPEVLAAHAAFKAPVTPPKPAEIPAVVPSTEEPAPTMEEIVVTTPGAQQALVEAMRAPETPDFENATSQAIDAWEKANRDFDKNLDVAVFGKEGAETYRRLQRTANSSTAPRERVDTAAEKAAKMEDDLTPEKQDILFGRKLPKDWVDPETARSLRAAVAEIDASENVGELAMAASRIIQGVLRASAEGRPMEGRENQLAARVMRKAAAMGVRAQDLVKAAFAYRSRIEGNDVFELAGVTPEQFNAFISPEGINGLNVSRIDRAIEALGRELSTDIAAERRSEIIPQVQRLTEERDRQIAESPRDIALQTAQREASQMPANAVRAQEFMTVASRLQDQGVKVDVFGQQFFAQGVRREVEGQIAALRQREAATQVPSEKAAITREISRRQERLAEVDDARGATFSPWHISLAVEDINSATTANIVTLLHEATEALAMRLNPVMRGRVLRAIDASMETLRERATAASGRTGVPRASETGAFDLLSETLAQELTANGVPDAPNLAQTIWRWVKDLYYRTAMALQAAFGAEPSDERTLDWFNNQLERLVGGDYDYRIARLLDRYAVAPMSEQVRRHEQPFGTPGGIADYFDPYTQRLAQPGVLPTSTESVDWNVQFQKVAPQRTQLGVEIGDVEARARIEAAALNRYIEEAEKVRVASGTELPWAEWWTVVGAGEDPRVMVAAIEGKLPGTATAEIGGDRMTKAMNDLAGLEARRLIENWQFKAQEKLAKTEEAITDQSDQVISAAKMVNKLEGDRRNAEIHEAALKDRLRNMVRRFVRDNSQGYKLAEQQGELAQALQQSEDLMDADVIPENFQRVFKSILDGEIPIFSYMRAIAELDLPLSDLTQNEVVKAIRDNADTNTYLGQLSKNRPLMVALAALARRSAGQMDEIHLGWLKDGEQYRKIHEELQTIRHASDSGLREMMASMDDRIKGATLRDRIVRDYLKRRREFQTARRRVAVAQARADAITSALPSLSTAVERAQQQGSEAPSDWTPVEGATFTEMRFGDDGQWTRHRRVLRFNPDGSAVDSAAVRSAIAQNNLWLKANESKAGSQGYETIKRQTTELSMRDMQAAYPAVQSLKLTRFLGLLADDAKKLGGRGAAELAQMFQAFEFVRFSHGQDLQIKSQAWSDAFKWTMKSVGIKDIGVFREQVYDPVNYYLNTNPGMDEEAALRNAVRAARERLTVPPADNFGEVMSDLLRKTKDVSEFLIGIGQQQGSFVVDERLKSELRRAVAQGWLTNMRSLDGGLVQRITGDMEKAGWKLARRKMKDRLERERQEVVKAVTFENLTPAEVAPAATPALDAWLKQLFQPGIVRSWLQPFINKGGVEVFKHGEDAIPQLVLQNAWAKANGNVLAWIDLVGQEVGLPAPETLENGATTDPVADHRLSMLRQLDALFGMESKLAAESSVSRDLFDPMGPKPHVMMDARLNDTIPPEHLDFAIYDPHSAQMLLAEIAFHSKFGRNGSRLQQMLDQLYSDVRKDKADYESLQGSTRAKRVAEAAARGQDYRDLERAADRFNSINALKKRVEAIFSIGGSGSVFEEARVGMELMNFMSGQIVDNPKTGLYDILSAFERPFGQRSLGPAAMKGSVRALALTAKGALGSILEALNLHILHSSDYYKTATAARGGSRNQPWAQAVADIGPNGQQGFTERVFIRPLRFLRYVQNKGVGSPAESREFPRLAPIPGLGVNNTIGQISGAGSAAATMMELEQMIRRGADYFSSHREDLENPSFRFAPKDLGFGRLDQGVFDWWRAKSVEYGLGNIEDFVRAAIPRLAKGEQPVTRDQALRATQMTMQEFNGQSSLLTTPSFMQSNPWLRRALPLLRWPFWKMAQVGNGLTTVDGKRDYAALVRGLATLAMWNLPIGLAFTFMLDRYDDEILGKKSNLPPLGKTASLPFIGPFAELIMSDRSIPDTLKAYAVRMARAGNIGGMATDVIGQFASPTDAGSGRRVFSLDQRVLAMSQFLNAQQAISNFAHQDWTSTWASVWAPLIRSLGGNGAIHGLDIVNNALGLDNAQSRQVTRTNANLWLRSAAGELDIELRTGGGSSTPTAMSVWTREMLSSAMANDRIGFQEAYRKAMDVARRTVSQDRSIPATDREREAEKRVLSGWRGRDPMTVFARRPSEMELRRLYSIMDDTGRTEVQEAIRRYRQFTRLIAPSEDLQQQRSLERRLSRNQMTNPFRRELSGSLR